MAHRLRHRWFAAIALVVALSSLVARAQAQSFTLSIPPVGQKTAMWCWAASGQMVMGYLGTPVQQCDEAMKEFGDSSCCNVPTPIGCIKGGWPQFDKYGFTFKTTSWGAPLTWAQLTDQIGNKHIPVAFAWGWLTAAGEEDGGHMMVAIGYRVVDGEHYVEIDDPWPVGTGDHRFVPYSEYVSASDHRHWMDFYDVAKIP